MQVDQAAQGWTAVKDSRSIAELEAFVHRFGDSFYTDLARLRINELKRLETARPVVPAVPVDPPIAAVVLPAAVPANAFRPCAGVTPVSLASRRAGALSAAEECGLQPKDSFRECAQCPEMVVVPRGSFIMGSPKDEEGHELEEEPQHKVTIAEPFAVGRFAVTFEEWDACRASGGCNRYRPSDQGGRRGNQPVINVSWDNAKAFVSWLSDKTGKPYRLLSEAEREYVARARTTTPFWFGASISTQQANYNGNYTYNHGVRGEWRKRTVQVNWFEQNPWGLYQVHGNVYEWTEDCFHDSYNGAPVDGAAWTALGCRDHVIRGGSWVNDPKYTRSGHRGNGSTSDSNIVGLRVARTLSQ